MSHIRIAILVAFAATLAVPTIASAHPSVYTDEVVIDTDPDPGEYTPGAQTRHVVTNHGFTYVLRESNGATDNGVVSYALLPGDYRSGLSLAQKLSEGNTGAQAHATCRGNTGEVADLWEPGAIGAWQSADPFYNYVPFQSTSAGLEDDPAEWIDDVQALTGVNLAQVTDLAAACAGLGGGATFVAADSIVTTAASLAAGSVAEATEPLEEEIDQLEADKAAALQAAATADAAAKAATTRALAAENAAAAAQADALRFRRDAAPLEVSLTDKRQSARAVARRGTTVELSGPPQLEVRVRLLIAKARAKAFGLKSNVLGSASVTIGDDGTATVDVTPKQSAAAALRKLKGSLKLSVSAVAGDRLASTSGTLTR